ncbi:DUF1183-domain-containing protein [Coniochaeta sp. PMI_546]|nr:DUF1183-domain-containing protein [Coniochaeta sp. PMI_546]
MHLDFLSQATLLLALLSTSTPTVSATKPKNAILLSEVQSLTLRAGKQTTHRRVPALPQLKCISPKPICALHAIDTMRCKNQGSGYTPEDIQWSCTASLPSTLKLGSTDVICEGYSSPDDPYVLRGSCGVEYRLVLTDEGERKYPDLAGKGGWTGGDTDWAGYLFGVVFVAVLAWIVWGACTAARAQPGQARRRPRGWGGGGGWGPGGGGGGGGGGGWDDPPPPYPGTKPDGAQGWRPGFWTGLAGGAAAAYMAGNRNRNTQETNYGRNNAGGWFGGNNNSDYGSTWGSGRTRSGGSSSSGSSARHESTGFGSTSRR